LKFCLLVLGIDIDINIDIYIDIVIGIDTDTNIDTGDWSVSQDGEKSKRPVFSFSFFY
jgi:hypothetical protein